MSIGRKRTNRGYWLAANRTQSLFFGGKWTMLLYNQNCITIACSGGLSFYTIPPRGGVYTHCTPCLPSQNFFCFIFFGVVQFCGVGDVLLPRGAVFGVYKAIWPHFAHRLYILSPASFSCDMRAFKTSRAVFFDIKKNKILRFSCYLGFS